MSTSNPPPSAAMAWVDDANLFRAVRHAYWAALAPPSGACASRPAASAHASVTSVRCNAMKDPSDPIRNRRAGFRLCCDFLCIFYFYFFGSFRLGLGCLHGGGPHLFAHRPNFATGSPSYSSRVPLPPKEHQYPSALGRSHRRVRNRATQYDVVHAAAHTRALMLSAKAASPNASEVATGEAV